MCEAKPGPRCSSDMSKAAKRAAADFERASIQHVEAQQRVIRATNDLRRNPNKDTEKAYKKAVKAQNKAVDKLNEATWQKRKKELQFFATPKGLKALEQQSPSSPSYKTASEHRKVQKMLLAKLNEANSVAEKRSLVSTFKQTIQRNTDLKNSAVESGKLNKTKIAEYKLSVVYNQILIEDLNDVELVLTK